ncbi:MAG: UpxY family transcription antiterminator [Leadbetterella sp.]|nr:UpxY family transcription antiterminator [Leadbetterella sp.]
MGIEVNSSWYVLYTRSRHEKKVEEELLKQGFESYCPKIKHLKKWSDRKKIVEEPLFKSYCFVKILENQKYEVLTTLGVVKFISFGGKSATLRSEIVERIKSMLNEFESREVNIEKLNEKDNVLIKSGVFIDNKGIVLEDKPKHVILFIKELGIKVKFSKSNAIIQKI